MSGIRLPRKLLRRIEGGNDPVAVFQEIVEIPCVTFNEYLMYEYILEEVEYLRDRLAPSQRDKLRICFTGASQFSASWRGRPEDPSKSILVAHVDREGLLVRKFDNAAGTALCWHTSGEMPKNAEGSRVRLVSADQAMKGVIEKVTQIPNPTPAQPFDHEVLVRVEARTRERGRNTGFRRNSFFEGLGVYDIPNFALADGVISAVHVDNTAGVSVLISLLNAIVKNSWRTNVDLLFTTCEEAGFCGVVSEILSGEQLRAKNGGSVMCIIVDSSSHSAFVEEKQLWDQESMSADSARIQEIVLQNVIVRTGDRVSLFDAEVSRLLSVAATNLQRSPGRHERIPWAGRHRPGISEKFREICKGGKPEAAQGAGSRSGFLTGRMRGGWCEATPLILADAIRQERGGLPPLDLHIGAVAIPIAHYRNFYKKALYPEKCHESALRATCQLLGEAIRLFHRWPFGVRGTVRHSGIPDQADRVKELLGYQDMYAGLSSVTGNWVSSQESRNGVSGPRH